MSVKYWTDRGAAVHFENGNSYISEAVGKRPKFAHVPLTERAEGFALRVRVADKTENARAHKASE